MAGDSLTKVIPYAHHWQIKRMLTIAMKRQAQAESLLYQHFKPYKSAKDEQYMSPPQQRHFRVLLENWRHQLETEAGRTMHNMQNETKSFPDDADRASQEEGFSIELRTRDKERKLIQKIDRTITLIDSGEYGYCTSCHVEIGVERLEARPTATLCIECKVLEESKEKHTRT